MPELCTPSVSFVDIAWSEIPCYPPADGLKVSVTWTLNYSCANNGVSGCSYRTIIKIEKWNSNTSSWIEKGYCETTGTLDCGQSSQILKTCYTAICDNYNTGDQLRSTVTVKNEYDSSTIYTDTLSHTIPDPL